MTAPHRLLMVSCIKEFDVFMKYHGNIVRKHWTSTALKAQSGDLMAIAVSLVVEEERVFQQIFGDVFIPLMF